MSLRPPLLLAFQTVLSLAIVAQPLMAQPSTVILVRHAERATTPASDPGLTEAGVQRAADLAAALAGARVTAIITTHLERTKLTARQVAEAIGQTSIVVRAGGPIRSHVDSVAAAVMRRPPGEVVLVVGHSNTVPAIIAALGGPTMPDLCENQYSSLFILQFAPNGPPRLIKARYGALDAPDAEDCARTLR